MPAEIIWLEAHKQRLGLLPHLGGAVAAWQWLESDRPIDLWRPWNEAGEDRYTLSSFAMVPWSNRISHGGFTVDGTFFPMRPNRAGEPYPIHGDGWLQPWDIELTDRANAAMSLESDRFGGNPYVYKARQQFTLVTDGLDQSVRVTHLGHAPLPYGLGLHPWFPRPTGTTLWAKIEGVWLSGNDPIPIRHSEDVQPDWDLRIGASMHGTLIDNCFTGWDGRARIHWPERPFDLEMETLPFSTPIGAIPPIICLVYRPPAGSSFCFEPVTHPIDAFHLAGEPGLVRLARGESVEMRVRWRIRPR